MDTNLTSVFMLSQAAYPEMKKAGGGKIINVGSMASYLAIGACGLCREQGGDHPVGSCLRRRMGEDNIQVNTILPGYIDTDMT